MKTRIFLLTVLIMSIMLASCTNPFLPVYDKTDQDGISVYIDGVRYKQLPKTKWQVKSGGRVIGYAGDKYTLVSECSNDPDRNFVYIKGYLAYRTDKTIPEPSSNSIDRIMWGDKLSSDNKEYTHITEDKDTIKALFEVLETGNRTSEFNLIKKDSDYENMYIGCYSSQLPGAYYYLIIGLSKGKIICGDGYQSQNDGYVEMPVDLLEKIAGKKIDISVFTEG